MTSKPKHEGGSAHATPPILVAVLALGGPIWTEDTNFGCGVAKWTSSSIDIFLTQ